MKTFATICVLTVTLVTTMSARPARADFDNDNVAGFAQFVANATGNVSNADLRELGVPRAQRIQVLALFNAITRDFLQIVELAGQPDNQVEDEIEDLARNIKQNANRLRDRGEDLNIDELVDFGDTIIEFADEILDEVG